MGIGGADGRHRCGDRDQRSSLPHRAVAGARSCGSRQGRNPAVGDGPLAAGEETQMDWRKTVDIAAVLNDASIRDEEKAARSADVLERSKAFPAGLVSELRRWSGDAYEEDYANAVLNRVYDFADANRIWMGI